MGYPLSLWRPTRHREAQGAGSREFYYCDPRSQAELRAGIYPKSYPYAFAMPPQGIVTDAALSWSSRCTPISGSQVFAILPDSERLALKFLQLLLRSAGDRRQKALRPPLRCFLPDDAAWSCQGWERSTAFVRAARQAQSAQVWLFSVVRIGQ